MASRGPLSDYPLAMVEWGDAHGAATGDYTFDEVVRDFHKPWIYRNFGLLIHEDEEGITMASEQCGDEVRGLSYIPRRMVKELVVLGLPRRPRRHTVRDPGPVERQET